MKHFVFIVKTEKCALDKVQNKFPSGVLLNICSASFQYICRKTSMPKGNFKKAAISQHICEDGGCF